MRWLLPRAVRPRLELIVALVILLGGALPVVTTWAQDSGAASFTVASASGNVVIRRANGTVEMATPGTELFANDQLASVGRSEAMLNTAGQGSGASLLLYSDTTIGVRSQGSVAGSSGAGTFYVADIAQGVVVARTPPTSGAALQITAESAGAVAQVNPGGGMAVASDVGTGTVAVACEDRQSQVYFPYVDDRVPCENNVVRTLSNQRTIEDDTADSGSPITAAVQAAGTNVAAVQQEQNQTQGNTASRQQDGDKDNAPTAVPASPTATGTPPPISTPTPTPVPSPAFAANCVVGSDPMSCTVTGQSLAGAQMGGSATIVTESMNASGAVSTETFSCGPITSSLTVSCGFTLAQGNRVFEGAEIVFSYPLAGGGSRSLTDTWTCNRPTGVRCP